MISAPTQAGFNQQSFEAFLSARNEPEWLVEQRREAWQTFCEKDWPARNDEEWMRTDIRLFKLNQFGLPLPLGEGRGEGVADSLLTGGVALAGRTAAMDSRPTHSQ